MSGSGAERAVDELRATGSTWLRGVLPDVGSLTRALTSAFELNETQHSVEALVAMGERGLLRNLGAFDRVFLDLLALGPVDRVVRSAMPGPIILNCFDALVLFPGEGRYPWDFHTDLMALKGVAFPADEIPAINGLYFVQDVDEVNGAPSLVAGSHRTVLRDPDPQLLAETARPISACAGDVLLFDARLWHCAGTNSSASPRTVVKALFTRPWFRPQLDFTRSVPPELFELADPAVRALLGESSAPPASVEDLRRMQGIGR